MSKKQKPTEKMAGQQDDGVKNNATSAESSEQINSNEEASTEIAEEKPDQQDFKAQYEDMKDKYLRLSAEFDNYRKRTLREKADILKYSAEDTLKDLLPVIDDLDRALKATETATDVVAVRDGLVLIINKFVEFIKSKGIKEIEAMGEEFNTDLHEAITKIPATDEKMKGRIVDVILKGYTINDKVMRFSKVVVGE